MSFRGVAVRVLFCAGVLLLGGCGGGGAGLSGPDSNTSAGFGTVVVRFGIDGDHGVVEIDRTDGPTFRVVRPTRGGRATFYNVPPGRFRVSGSRPTSEGNTTVDVVADKTVTVSVSSSTSVTPAFFPSPTPFGN